MSKKTKLLVLALTTLALFAAAIHPVITYDTFFGLKIGEWVVKNRALPTTEPFSWSAFGRPIIAYEWLAQALVYLLHQLGGFKALEIYVAAAVATFFLLAFFLFRRALSRDFTSSLSLALFLSTATYEFFVARPQIITFVLFLALLYLLYSFVLAHRNSLLLTLPLTYIWTNSHASFILIPFLFFSLAPLSFLYSRHQPHPAQAKAKTLLFYGSLNLLVTLLPPLWFGPYRLLLNFISDLRFMTQFVSEWGPLAQNPTYQLFYPAVALASLLTSIFFSIKYKRLAQWLLALPLLALILASFQAIRHVPLGLTASLILLGIFLPNFKFTGWVKIPSLVTTALLLIISVWFIPHKRAFIDPGAWGLPTAEMQFLQANKLQGRMFNDFALGGFLIYHLYPDYQVFFDGRADIYHTKEMRDFWPLITAKKTSREYFSKELKTFWDKYQFSYAILPITSYNPLEFTATSLITDTWYDDPNFSLIYFSDRLLIFIFNNGQNQPMESKFALNGLTPTRLTPYRRDSERAAPELLRLISIQDSGLARTTLGQIYLSQNDLAQAESHFNQATQLNPFLGTPHVGLAKIALEQKATATALTHLKSATRIAPYLGEAYLLLGQIYIDTDQPNLARTTLTAALDQNIDLLSRQKIVLTLSQLQ